MMGMCWFRSCDWLFGVLLGEYCMLLVGNYLGMELVSDFIFI